MKKIISLVLGLVLLASLSWADTVAPVQVTCTGTATLLYTAPSTSIDVSKISVAFAPTTAATTVYIGQSATLTTGIPLNTTGILGYVADGKRGAWYCVTGGSSVVVTVAEIR